MSTPMGIGRRINGAVPLTVHSRGEGEPASFERGRIGATVRRS